MSKITPVPRAKLASEARRSFLRQGFMGLGVLVAGPAFARCGGDSPLPSISNIGNLGPLGEPDENGLRLPAGFTSRVVARSGETVVDGSEYTWHRAPDGGATFSTSDGGWVYVSNSEAILLNQGGAGAIRFDRRGQIVAAYSILGGTRLNCAGGPTPWGTWLSCEEHSNGGVYECDPLGEQEAVLWPALGRFKHEAAAVDPILHHVYLTEDESNGRLYRFTPDALVDGRSDLSAGTLEVMQVLSGEEGEVAWLPIADPSGTITPTRLQSPSSTAFSGGEGIWYHDRVVYFATKGDDRVWAYDLDDESLLIIYDAATFPDPILTGVDNLTVTSGGYVVVAEDPGLVDDDPENMQVVAITPEGELVALVQVEGHAGSEVAGVAFDPTGQRLYFSSQRGASGALVGSDGVTYEVRGPFLI